MSAHSKNAGAKIKYSITVAKCGCLIFTPHMASPILTYNATEIIFENFQFSNLTPAFILANSAAMPDTGADRFFAVQPDMIDINTGTFSNPGGGVVFPPVWVQYSKGSLTLGCSCNYGNHKLCSHQAQVLYNIMERPDLRLFFDAAFRHDKIQAVAKNYGLEQSPNPDEHFELVWQNKTVRIEPRMKALQPINEAALKQLAEELLPPPEKRTAKQAETLTTILVLSAHKYYQHLQVGLYEAPTSTGGKIKNPLQSLNAEAMVWTSAEAGRDKILYGCGGLYQQPSKKRRKRRTCMLCGALYKTRWHCLFTGTTLPSRKILAPIVWCRCNWLCCKRACSYRCI